MTFAALALCLGARHICAEIQTDIPELDEPAQLTSDVVLCTVQHVCGVDELVAGASDPQLRLCVAQNDLPPGKSHPKITSLLL